MLKIKLSPTGKKNDRHYRVVITEAKSKITGKNVDLLGHFHPRVSKSDPGRFVLDKNKLKNWLAKGATPTAKIRRLADL